MRLEAYDDNVRPFFPAVLDRLKRFDARLVLRRNRQRGTYELWRYRDEVPIPSNPTSSEISQKAVIQMELRDQDLNHGLFRRLWLADVTRVTEARDARAFNKALEAQEAADEAKKKKEIDTLVDDLVTDNRRQLRRDFTNVYAGYYG